MGRQRLVLARGGTSTQDSGESLKEKGKPSTEEASIRDFEESRQEMGGGWQARGLTVQKKKGE